MSNSITCQLKVFNIVVSHFQTAQNHLGMTVKFLTPATFIHSIYL